MFNAIRVHVPCALWFVCGECIRLFGVVGHIPLVCVVVRQSNESMLAIMTVTYVRRNVRLGTAPWVTQVTW
jgi:hypothetical protein